MWKIANAFLLVCGMAAAPCAVAASNAEAATGPARIDRMTDAMVEFMPMGRIFDLALADSPYTNWTTASHAIQDAVDAAQMGIDLLSQCGNIPW